MLPGMFPATLASILNIFDPAYLFSNPVVLGVTAFQIWMAVDALRRREFIWAIFILIGWGISALMYFMMVYRAAGPAGGGLQGFELPGASHRRRIKELQGRIHHLDHARDHLDLADIYFAQGKLIQAENSYRESLKRDATDVDTLAHLGQCLLRQRRPAEARPLLEQVTAQNPHHDYGHTLMALAEVQMALGEAAAARETWESVLSRNNYARARVQYAEILAGAGERDRARRELQEALADDAHVPVFQRKRDRVWMRRARKALATL